MKFLVVMRHELRSCRGFLIVAGLVQAFFTLPYLISTHFISRWQRLPADSSGLLRQPSIWDDYSVLLWCLAIGLGLALALRQFLYPGVTREWGFQVHRPLSRRAIAAAKLAAGACGLLLPTALIWALAWSIGNRPGHFPAPEPMRILVDGWSILAWGYAFYLGTALTAVQTTRWYGTRLFGLLLPVGTLCLVSFGALPLMPGLCVLAATIVLLVLAVLGTVMEREF